MSNGKTVMQRVLQQVTKTAAEIDVRVDSYIGIYASDISFAQHLIGTSLFLGFPELVIEWEATTKNIMLEHVVRITECGQRHYYIRDLVN